MAADAARWRWQHVLESPHRLGFLLASALLVAAGAWWAVVQWQRTGLGPGYAFSPALVHAAAMSFGFMPLFFGGFLFTAGPRWLAVPPPLARSLLPAFGAQAAGWLLWIVGAHLHAWLSLAGLLLALAGLAGVGVRFWRLIAASRMPDRLHPRLAGTALLAGCASLAGLAVALALQDDGAARRVVLTGLWAFIVVVYVTVADRMIPFFTAGAVPSFERRHPHATLALMLGMASFEAAAPWIEEAIGASAGWLVLRGGVEAAAGALLLALAVAWARFKPLRTRMLVMLHVGFAWLGVSFLLAGVGHLLSAAAGAPVLPLAGLHALTMGCLGSLMLTMVSRVSCGQSGRPNVTDNFLWSLFWLLQLSVLLRIAADAWPAGAQRLLPATALLWACIMLAWGIRHGNWYGRAREDRRAG